MKNAYAPIGIFDSGLGGLSIFTHLAQLLPNENYIYLADTLHVPYGSRSEAEIQQLTLQAIDWLIAQGCKLVVIACNSASAYGLQEARQSYPDFPIVGLVPALKPAVLQTKTNHVAVLATVATLKGRLLNAVIEEIAQPKNVTVHKYAIASLVLWVEAGMPEEHQAVTELEALLQELHEKQIDQLVLGCTHYPFFKHYLTDKIRTSFKISAYQPIDIHLVDSGQAIAKRVLSLLDNQQLCNQQIKPTVLQFFSTANQAHTQQIAEKLITQFDPERQVKFFQATFA